MSADGLGNAHLILALRQLHARRSGSEALSGPAVVGLSFGGQGLEGCSQVKEACIEADGRISVMRKND